MLRRPREPIERELGTQMPETGAECRCLDAGPNGKTPVGRGIAARDNGGDRVGVVLGVVLTPAYNWFWHEFDGAGHVPVVDQEGC